MQFVIEIRATLKGILGFRPLCQSFAIETRIRSCNDFVTCSRCEWRTHIEIFYTD